jgi:outer membrane immunogenic protein
VGDTMKKLFLAGIAATAFCSAPALAADMPVKAPYAAPFDWSGFYLGGQVGYLWGHTRIEETGTRALGPTNGVIGGVLGGANWQTGRFVLGAEADFGWSNAHGMDRNPVTMDLFTYEIRTTTHARGRIGYDFNGTLVYLAGGFAVAHAHVEEMNGAFLVGKLYSGGTIGAGIEHAFTRQILGRIEYLYDDFGHKTYTTGADTYRVGVTGQTVRAAVVYKFGS